MTSTRPKAVNFFDHQIRSQIRPYAKVEEFDEAQFLRQVKPFKAEILRRHAVGMSELCSTIQDN